MANAESGNISDEIAQEALPSSGENGKEFVAVVNSARNGRGGSQ
jgi:hypothetical protein